MGLGLDQPSHWLIIALVALVLFGYKKLPEMARSAGRSMRIFKTELKGMADDDDARGKADGEAPTEASAADAAAAAKAAELHEAEKKAAALRAELDAAEQKAAELKSADGVTADGVTPRAS